MKAHEVLNRYAKGERDFRRANLRGQSFKGEDLSGADFTESEIRGANFSNATLRDTDFTLVKAGLQKSRVALTSLAMLIVASTAGFFAAFGGILMLLNLDVNLINKVTIFPGLIALSMAIIYVAIRLGNREFNSIPTAIRRIFVLAAEGYGVLIGAAAGASVVAGKGFMIMAVGALLTGAITVSLALTLQLTMTPVRILTGKIASFVVPVGLVSGSIFGTETIVGSSNLPALTMVGLVTLGMLVEALWACERVINEDPNLNLTRAVAIYIASLGGTNFENADLTSARFTEATLKSSILQDATLTYVCWKDVRMLKFARANSPKLTKPAVRELLVTHNGYKKSYIDANLRGANLNGINLKEANLKWADLSEATLHYADLCGADLSEALVLGTDFTGASLTGACLEAWNIDSNTNLDHVDCQYVYLLRDRQERRPSSGDFAPGEFTKLFQEALNTVDLIFRNGVDWKAFVAAFQTVQVENDGTELTIQSIENKGDGVVVVRVSVPVEADKAKIHSEFNHSYEVAVKALEARYHAELKAKDEQITIYREKSADMTEILRLLANRPVTVEVNASAESKAMTESNDSSRKIATGNIGRDFNPSGQALNLGDIDISGTVTNTINQLPSSPDPDQPGIKELLTQLQTAIADAKELSTEDKTDALEQVQAIAELGKNPQHPDKESIWRKAKKILTAPIPGLPETATVFKAIGDILPAIAKLLSLAV